MRDTVKTGNGNPRSLGFTLIEMSIALVIIGLLIAPAAMIYRNYEKQKKWEKTESSISLSMTALGGFRANFGRYPCPAPMNVGPTDPGYGIESCPPASTPPGSCVNGVCVIASFRAGIGPVLRGAIPFKTLDLQENEAYDGYHWRLRYAVTGVLTESTTFDLNKGGVGLIDRASVTMVVPRDSLHFVIVSPGENGRGAVSRQGSTAIPCPPAAEAEAENCNANPVYRQVPFSDTFDDRVAYFSPVELSQWQKSEDDARDIHLKFGNTGNVAIGATPAVDLTGAESLAVRDSASEQGIVWLENNAGYPVSHDLMRSFNVQRLCEYDATNPSVDCFSPALLGGQIATGGGMDCGADKFLVGIKNRAPVCKDEVFVSCPDGQFIAGVRNGKIECSAAPPEPCLSKEVTTFCGLRATLPDTRSGDPGYAYSGKCYKLPPHTRASYEAATASMTPAQRAAYVLDWNKTPRIEEDCGPTEDKALTRDVYQCEVGTWTYKRTHERAFKPSESNWPSHEDASVSWRAEQSTPWSWSLGPSGQVTPDSMSNNSEMHDCWCREDYKAELKDCPFGATGQFVQISKVACPNTKNWRWEFEWNDFRGCPCVPGDTVTSTPACTDHFAVGSGTMEGNVIISTHKDCVSPAISTTDTTGCICKAKAPILKETPCPVGQTNSFVYEGETKTGVAAMTKQEWICPKGDGNWVVDKNGAGRWGAEAPVAGIPACACDSSVTDTVDVPCSTTDPEIGGVKTYKKKWDCSLNGGLGGWEEESKWVLVASNCSTCRATPPATAPTLDNFDGTDGAPGVVEGKSCPCGDTLVCRRDAGGDAWDIWNSCSCMPN